MRPSTIREVRAKDGLRARDNGEWAREKLDFISTFGPPALQATRKKHSRWYIDLFAGPGINVVRGGTEEIEGSALRAIGITTPDGGASFTDAVFVNRDRRDHDALEARVTALPEVGRCRIPKTNIRMIRGDANKEVTAIMRQIHPRSYAFVFADMEAPRQFPWTSVMALTEGGHESVDLYMLFPLDMAIKRLISTNQLTVEQSARTLTAFFGDEEWRPLLRHRRGSSHDLGPEAQHLYLEKLRSRWKFADEVCDIRRGRHHRLYKMLYASNNPAGKRIATWAAKRNAPPSLFA